MGIIRTHSIGRIRFHYNGIEYYFRFNGDGTAFLYRVESMEGTTSTFHKILLSDATEIGEVEKFLEREIIKRKNASQSSDQPAS